MRAEPIGLYVHIPFCKSKCSYCDFCSFPEKTVARREEYVAALCREISSYKKMNISVDSVFFGGGTPSLLTAEELSRISDTITSSFDILPDTEFTIESNPKTLTRDKLTAFRTSGVNRISLGLQSIHENEMKLLGRIHNFDDFLFSYEMVKNSGISNINVDLMYGIPSQTIESFGKTLEAVASLAPPHLSLYGLILEEGTPLYNNRENYAFPTEDEECDMYYLARDILADYGYRHYEISNYAKEGFECRHNLKYWHAEEYIGVGLSAYSYFGGKRFGNTKSFDEYFCDDSVKYDCETIDVDTQAYEYAMLRLRLSEGFSLDDYKSRFSIDFCEGREEKIEKLVSLGYLARKDGRISLTDSGMYVSNTILTELL